MKSDANSDRQHFLGRNATDVLKGLAIILLVSGHFCAFCIEGTQLFENAGATAVVIFLFLSGIGLTKTYGLSQIDLQFALNRLRKLLFPMWITLILFYSLDYIVLGKIYHPLEVILNFIGILRKAPPNPPIWFVSYIIYLYILFAFVSILPIGSLLKSVVLLGLCFMTTITIDHFQVLQHFFSGWTPYTSAFPLSVILALNEKHISRWLWRLQDNSTVFLTIGLLTSGVTYILAPILKTLFLIVFLTLFVYCLDLARIRVRILSQIGKYSYEIYLLHFPFMVSYGFVKGQVSFVFSFISYIVFILLLSILLNKASQLLSNKLLCMSMKWTSEVSPENDAISNTQV